MAQIRVSLEQTAREFVLRHKEYGYASNSAIINDAVKYFQTFLHEKALIESADLYQEVYESDSDLQELTDDAAGLCLE